MAAWEQFTDKHSKSNVFISAEQGPSNQETAQTKAVLHRRGPTRASWDISDHKGGSATSTGLTGTLL